MWNLYSFYNVLMKKYVLLDLDIFFSRTVFQFSGRKPRCLFFFPLPLKSQWELCRRVIASGWGKFRVRVSGNRTEWRGLWLWEERESGSVTAVPDPVEELSGRDSSLCPQSHMRSLERPLFPKRFLPWIFTEGWNSNSKFQSQQQYCLLQCNYLGAQSLYPKVVSIALACKSWYNGLPKNWTSHWSSGREGRCGGMGCCWVASEFGRTEHWVAKEWGSRYWERKVARGVNKWFKKILIVLATCPIPGSENKLYNLSVAAQIFSFLIYSAVGLT